MAFDPSQLGFPGWLRITHYLNIALIFVMIRSGIQILMDFPRYFFNEHCKPGTEWIKLSKKKIPPDRLWTSSDEATYVSPWLALPGGEHKLGIGRYWHFTVLILWVLNGLTYVTLLFATGNWRRLIPTSWDIFPRAWHTFVTYITFHIPPESEFRPYDPLQQLAYLAVVFILVPLFVATGLAMSPAVAAQFPWYPRLFRGRQTARSLHFIFLVLLLLFIVIHISLVIIVRFRDNIDHMVLGREDYLEGTALAIAAVALGIVVAAHVAITRWSRRNPRSVQRFTSLLVDPMMQVLSYLKSRQHYQKQLVSPYFWVNGYPPTMQEWHALAQGNFSEYALEVNGLVEEPLWLTIEDLRSMPHTTQITKHVCIQGWSGIAEWSGVPLCEVLQRCRPLPNAKYVVFHSYQEGDFGGEYYESLEMREAHYPQTILAYEMNGETLPLQHGAPLRLRMESKLGFKMVKWIRSIEITENFWGIGDGYGGYREDRQFHDRGAAI